MVEVSCTIRGGGPTVALVVRDERFATVQQTLARDGATLELDPGLYVFEASYTDGRFIRTTVRLTSGRPEVVTLPPEQETEAVALVVESRAVERPPRQPRASAMHSTPRAKPAPRRMTGLKLAQFVTRSGEPAIGNEKSLGDSLERLRSDAFTGTVNLRYEGREQARLWLRRGHVSAIDIGGERAANLEAALENVSSWELAQTEVFARRTGYFVGAWQWDGQEWHTRSVERAENDLAPESAPGVGLLQVINPWRSEFVAFTSDLPDLRLSMDKDGRVEARFEPRAQALLTFVNLGDRQGAAVLARRFIQKKYDRASLAAVGGYYLLDTHDDHSIPPDWWDNLANIEWLPDGAILAGWRALRAERIDEARDWFLSAVRRGLPLFTRGLLLALEGLWAFGDDAEVRAAAERLRPYADSARRAALITTFGGASPERPTRLEAPMSPPERFVRVPKHRLCAGLLVHRAG